MWFPRPRLRFPLFDASIGEICRCARSTIPRVTRADAVGRGALVMKRGTPMAHLPEHPTLPELQRYLDAVCQERGWTKDSYAEKFLLFTEEVGELAKAIRKAQGLYQEQARQKRLDLEEEFAD